jgi:hypothetical protein
MTRNCFHHPERDLVYELLVKYYDNPVMKKVKDQGNMSTYMIQLPCFLLNEKRYLIVLASRDDGEIGILRPLYDLRWKAIMARSINDDSYIDLPIHNYSIKRDDRYLIPLTISSRSKEISIYKTSIESLEVSLLHVRGQEYEYPNEGNLVSALETFKTIISWKN